MSRIPHFIAIVMAALVVGTGARAQNVANGAAIYGSVCVACHGPASANFNNIVTVGANNPAAILSAWLTFPQMNSLAMVYNAQDRADIAAYLGTFLPPSGEIRASATTLDFGAQAVGSRSATQSLTVSNFTGTVTVTSVSSNDAPEFPIVVDTCTGATLGPSATCHVDIAFQPAATGPRGATIMIANTGVVNPVSVTAIGAGGTQAPAVDYQGLWWGGNAEDGWGINLAQQGDLIYLTWYTFDANGKASWLAMLATKNSPSSYGGGILEVHGSPFDVTPYNPAAKSSQTVGNGTLVFSDANNGTFSFTAKGVSRSIPITRFVFGPAPVCVQTPTPNFAAATNYQDLWWTPSEDGWGINFSHQGNLIYATWYTYDHDGSPLWLAALLTPTSATTWSGAMLRVSGAPFGPTYDASKKIATTVGTATLSFADGNSATWSYTVGTTSGQKAITRFTFATPVTLCH